LRSVLDGSANDTSAIDVTCNHSRRIIKLLHA
jgi:hypothetical protein